MFYGHEGSWWELPAQVGLTEPFGCTIQIWILLTLKIPLFQFTLCLLEWEVTIAAGEVEIPGNRSQVLSTNGYIVIIRKVSKYTEVKIKHTTSFWTNISIINRKRAWTRNQHQMSTFYSLSASCVSVSCSHTCLILLSQRTTKPLNLQSWHVLPFL